MQRTSIHVDGVDHNNPVPAAFRVGGLPMSGLTSGAEPGKRVQDDLIAVVDEGAAVSGLSEATLSALRATTTATVTTQLMRRGLRNTFLQGVRPLGDVRVPMVGPAFTLRYIPPREDLDSYGAKPDPNAKQREAIEAVPPGHVLVMDCRQDARAAAAGDVFVTRLHARGIAGLVSDGGIRNSFTIRGMALPVFCAGPSAPTNRVLHHAIDSDLPIACGGVVVYPGDIVMGDADGITSSRAPWWTRWRATARSRRSWKRSSSAGSRPAKRYRDCIR